MNSTDLLSAASGPEREFTIDGPEPAVAHPWGELASEGTLAEVPAGRGHHWVMRRWLFIAAIVVAACHSTILSVSVLAINGDSIDYVFLMPIWVLVMSLGMRLRLPPPLPIDDRQTDWIAAALTMSGFVMIDVLLEPRLGYASQTLRPDILAMWLLLIAAKVLLFGLRSVGRYALIWAFVLCSLPSVYRIVGASLGGSVSDFATLNVLISVFAVCVSLGRPWRRFVPAGVATFVVGQIFVVGLGGAPDMVARLLPALLAAVSVATFFHLVVEKDKFLKPLHHHAQMVVKFPVASYIVLGLTSVLVGLTNPGVPAQIDPNSLAWAKEAFTISAAPISSWQQVNHQNIGFASEFYGAGAIWNRYRYTKPTPGSTKTLQLAPQLLVVDAITGNRISPFSVYGTPLNYSFASPYQQGKYFDLGHGVHAQLFYTNVARIDTPTHQLYEMLTWTWRLHTGSGVQYQRITMITPFQAQVLASIPDPARPVSISNLGLTLSDIIRGVPPDSYLPPDAIALARLRSAATTVVDDLVVGGPHG